MTGGDFRAGMYFDVLALGGLALASIVVAKKLRGGLKFTDAALPLACLHWGHYDNFLMCLQVLFVAPVVLTCSLLLIIVTSKSPFPTVRAYLAGVCLVLLGFCGAGHRVCSRDGLLARLLRLTHLARGVGPWQTQRHCNACVYRDRPAGGWPLFCPA